MSAYYTRALALTAAGVLIGVAAIGSSVSSNSSGVISIAFNAQSGAPMPESTVVVGATNSPCLAAGGCSPVSYVSFSFLASDCVPSQLQLCLNCQDGRQWYRTLTLPAVGVWKQYIVAVDYSQGWTIGPWKTEALFQGDSTNIVSAGLTVSRAGSTAAQSYTVVDFALQGAGWGAADSDGDGVCNADEVLAGTNPFDKDSVLAVSVWSAADVGQGFGLAWDSVADHFYSVWRGTNLAAPWVLQQSSIPACVPRNVYWDAGATGSGPYFYKVTVDNPVQ